MHDAVAEATSAHNAMKAPPASLGQAQELVEGSSTSIDGAGLVVDPWVPLLEKIEVLAGVVDKISEVRSTFYMSSILTNTGFCNLKVHPYAKAAWSILSATYKVRS